MELDYLAALSAVLAPLSLAQLHIAGVDLDRRLVLHTIPVVLADAALMLLIARAVAGPDDILVMAVFLVAAHAGVGTALAFRLARQTRHTTKTY